MYILYFILCAAAGAVGGLIFRWRGGGEPTHLSKWMPRPVDQILFSTIYSAIAFIALDMWWAIIVSAITVLMVSLGHGRNMDLGSFDNTTAPDPEAVAPEWYEFIIAPLYGRLSEYWYDAVGLMVSGLTYTLPLGIAMANPIGGYFIEGIIIGLSGALKAPAYMLARYFVDTYPDEADLSRTEVYKVLQLKIPTQWGEFLTGVFLWGFACAVLISMLLPMI